MVKYKIPDEDLVRINNVLVIQTAFIGDAILSTTIFKGIKKILPECNVDVLAIPQTSNLFKHNPNIRNVFEFDKRKMKNRLISFIKIQKLIRNNRYDAAISIQSSITSSILMLLGLVKIRIGYPRQKLLSYSIYPKKGLHIRKRVLRLLEPLSNETLDDQTELFWGNEEADKAAQLIGENEQKLVAIAPGSAQFTKQWPKEYFIKLIDLMSFNDVKIFLVGGADDRELCNDIVNRVKINCINVAGELTILDSAALISKTDLVISNDSAPLHIANAVKTDVFAIFGPTVREFGFYPYREDDRIFEIDIDCRPCGKHGGKSCPLGHFKCMRDLTPEMVYKEVWEHCHY
jgi:heptosyltransferase-2